MNARLDSHLFGLESEMRFERECEARGIRVCRPISDQTAVDRVLITPVGCFAVQIKSVRTVTQHARRKGDRRECYVVDNFRRNGDRFSACSVAFLAVYIGPLDRWHLFRANERTAKRIKISAAPTGRVADSINNWKLLRLGQE